MTLASKIADFIWNANYTDIPKNVKDLAKRALVDYVAATSIGANASGSEIIKRYVAEKPQNDECKAIRVNGYFTMEDAALMNGYFAHLLDYDDAGLTGHPSAVLMSTCFAVGETLASSGEDLMTAYILGYEVSLKIADALMPELTGRGWHGTPVFGTIGAAVCAGKIMKLPKEVLVNAIGIAATMASGLMENFGTNVKPFHAGMAASNGIKAVKLAKAGLIASPVALEGKCGYAKLFSKKSITENAIRFGDSWKLLLQDLLIKKYPCCSASHAALNGMEELMEENRLHYHDVKRVVVGVPKFTLINLIHPEPKNPTEARFSMHYALASVLVTGRFDVNSFHSKALNNEEVRSVMKRIEMKEGEDFKETPYIDNEPAVIDLYTYDGHYYHKRIDFAKGTTVNPFTEDELAEKFFACLGGETEKNKKVLENLRNIENIPDVRFFLGMAL